MQTKKIYTKQIERPLTADEIRERGEELAKKVAEVREFEEKKTAAAKHWGEEIKEVEKKMTPLLKQIAEKKQEFPVEVYDDYNYRTGYVYTRRVDDDIVVSSRELTMNERQNDLFDSKLPEPSAAQVNSLRANKDEK